MTDFIDHNVEARVAVLERAYYVGRPNMRALTKHNILAVSAAFSEARRVMAGNAHLEVIEGVLAVDMFEDLMNYVATFIPKGEDDDLRGAFENIGTNCSDSPPYDEDFFDRLDGHLEDFRREQLGQFRGGS